MYQLISAIARPATGNTRWRPVDIGNMSMAQIYSSYLNVIAVLSNPFIDHQVSFNLNEVIGTQGGSSQTFNAFLTANGNNTLPTSDTIPTINITYAKYADAFHAGYDVEATHPTASSSSTMPESEKPWLQLTKSGVDYNLFYTSCLVNINGFYHRTDAGADGAYVVDGNKTSLRSRRNEIGIYSFREVGTLSFIPITDDMIYTQNSDQVLKDNCYVDTGIDLSKKTVMLVLGGYLHVLDKLTFKRISDSAFKINFADLPLIDRYYESFRILDLTSLGMETTPNNDSQISVSNIYSDAVLRKYLTLSQTFFVVLDNPEIFIETEFVQPSPFPGVYKASTKPYYPLVLGAGRHETYWYQLEEPYYSVHANASLRGERIYYTTDMTTANSVSENNNTIYGQQNSMAMFLRVGSDNVVIP